MDKDTFKTEFFELYMQYVKASSTKRGIVFDISEFTDKLLEKYEIKKRES